MSGILANLKPATMVVAAVLTSGVGGAAYTVDEWRRGIETEVADLKTDKQIRDYQRLLAKYTAEGKLSVLDTRKFCSAARGLGIGGPIVKKVCF